MSFSVSVLFPHFRPFPANKPHSLPKVCFAAPPSLRAGPRFPAAVNVRLVSEREEGGSFSSDEELLVSENDEAQSFNSFRTTEPAGGN